MSVYGDMNSNERIIYSYFRMTLYYRAGVVRGYHMRNHNTVRETAAAFGISVGQAHKLINYWRRFR